MSELRELDLVMLDSCEGFALRGVLEGLGFTVNRLLPGRPRDLLAVLSGAASHAPHVLLSCHSDDRGVLLEELAPEVAREEPFTDVLTPERLTTFVNLPGRVAVSTGCSTGSAAFARAFLEGGCDASIAPAGDLDGNAALFFMAHLCYELAAKRPLPEAIEWARAHDDETRLFRLFTRDTPPLSRDDLPTADRRPPTEGWTR